MSLPSGISFGLGFQSRTIMITILIARIVSYRQSFIAVSRSLLPLNPEYIEEVDWPVCFIKRKKAFFERMSRNPAPTDENIRLRRPNGQSSPARVQLACDSRQRTISSEVQATYSRMRTCNLVNPTKNLAVPSLTFDATPITYLILISCSSSGLNDFATNVVSGCAI
jgi:hypothetical protein